MAQWRLWLWHIQTKYIRPDTRIRNSNECIKYLLIRNLKWYPLWLLESFAYTVDNRCVRLGLCVSMCLCALRNTEILVLAQQQIAQIAHQRNKSKTVMRFFFIEAGLLQTFEKLGKYFWMKYGELSRAQRLLLLCFLCA